MELRMPFPLSIDGKPSRPDIILLTKKKSTARTDVPRPMGQEDKYTE
jgi:hypothetical protein